MLLIDEALSKSAHASLLDWHERQELDRISEKNFIRSLPDAEIERGRYFSFFRQNGETKYSDNWDSALAPLAELVFSLVEQHTFLSKTAYSSILAPWRYTCGAAMASHRDYTLRAAVTFVYWCGIDWKSDWRGNLLISTDRNLLGETCPDPTQRLIAPMPNRLVLFNSYNLHAVEEISASAQGVARLSITGMISTGS